MDEAAKDLMMRLGIELGKLGLERYKSRFNYSFSSNSFDKGVKW